MDSEEDHAGLFQGDASLRRDLPKILIERQNKPRFGLAEI
jgi:hypothetical protein